MSIEEIISEIEKRANIPKNEIMERIRKKQEELCGLVSQEGAAYLVAKEINVNLLDEKRRRLEMKNLIGGMRKVNIIGRVFKVSEKKNFKRKDGSEGSVVNILLSDGTDFVRLPLWDEQTRLLEEIGLGDVVQVFNAFAKEDVFGNIEISLGRYGDIKKIENEDEIPRVEELIKKFFLPSFRRVLIKDIEQGNFEIMATIVHVFKGKFLFDICSICGNTLEFGKCEEHGEVEPEKSIVISCIGDDGSDNIRIVFFREQAEKVCGIKVEELVNMREEERYDKIARSLLGKELILQGRVRKNRIFDRIEFLVSDFKELNVFEEAQKIIEEIEKFLPAK